jgi:dihydroorotase
VNYGFFIGATPDNIEELNSIENVPGIKIFMAASTGSLLVSDRRDVERIFQNGSRLIAVHSEDQSIIENNKVQYAGSTHVEDHMRIRSADAALSSTKFLVDMSKKYNRRLHILHLTTRDEVEYLRAEKVPGLISTELCPQHFLLKAPDDYERLGTYAQMNPPIRSAEHGEALWEGLKDGVIDCMATDHAPHTREEKDQPFGEAPSGMPGVETVMPLMLHQANQGRCSVNDVVKWLCEKPVELYGVKGKGRIAPGYDADIVLVDLSKTREIRDGELQTKSNWSPYHGWQIKGWPVVTMVNGNVVFREGEFFNDVKGREICFGDR